MAIKNKRKNKKVVRAFEPDDALKFAYAGLGLAVGVGLAKEILS